MKLKTENRQNHRWGDPDDYNISSCLVCGKLRKRVAATNGNLRSSIGFHAWEDWYSNKGTKWTKEHLDCL